MDDRFGLNGKRGNPNDISDDAINFVGEGPGHDPLTGQPVTVFDVIRGAGGPNPEPSWDRIDQAGPGAWVKPVPVLDTPPEPDLPKPVEKPYPGDLPGQLIAVQLFEDYALRGEAPNPDMGIWIWRCAWDMSSKGLTADQVVEKHRAEWRRALGLP